jgi:TonB family protein
MRTKVIGSDASGNAPGASRASHLKLDGRAIPATASPTRSASQQAPRNAPTCPTSASRLRIAPLDHLSYAEGTGGVKMYMRLFTTVAVVASFAFGSAWAQQDENGQPTQYGAYPGVVERHVWGREVSAYVLNGASEYWHDVDGQKLRKYLSSQKGGWERVASIVFVVNRTGHIASAKVWKSSGDALCDKAALAMVRRADPVPVPPPLPTDHQLTLRQDFHFSP